ncbi:NAD(P)-binding protein [Aspergillus ellipticus CBS 707.79]|uniref:NAD(P)-binding protein n=1 Tax=Aspergillus ellipticus CBS 707.79 TaxID=1448320 RepID=A0A319E907_9EURO|nr:NAD(P)-binding protein [Aspergillus ellipticus CBS 707.79]
MPGPPMKRYALIGTAIVRGFRATAQLVAFCDTNRTRLAYATTRIQAPAHPAVPTYAAHDFDRMIAETRPDEVIVTTIDRTHHPYIVRALELGCAVISEKPMTIDAPRCLQIFDAGSRTGKPVRVTFNYRYAPHNGRVAELLAEGAIGEVHAVHFEWMLNTSHGADYFRRGHRDKRNSGWGAAVVAMGDLRFYGKENAEGRGERRFYSRTRGSEVAQGDPFALDREGSETLKALYADAEEEDGYFRDQSVFGDGISIEATMGVLVRYRSGAVLTYSLTAYAPWEGFRVNFTGSWCGWLRCCH